MYPSTVHSQSEDGSTVDLLPDDDSIRGNGLQAVQLWHGLPGIVVKVPKGARVLLGFRNGAPDQPYAALWEPGQIESISFGGGTIPIARVGDSATVYWPPSQPFIGTTAAGPLTGTMTITTPAIAIIDRGSSKATA
jgi:hypothetical protein